MRTYSRILRMVAIAAVVCVAYLVVMTDHTETREGFEFVPVQSK